MRQSTPAAPEPQKFIQAAPLAKLLGISRAAVWAAVRGGRMPAPTYVAGSIPVWDLATVLAGMSATPTTRRRQPKVKVD